MLHGTKVRILRRKDKAKSRKLKAKRLKLKAKSRKQKSPKLFALSFLLSPHFRNLAPA